MHAGGVDAVIQQRQEALGAFHAMAIGAVGYGIVGEVRVAIVQAEVGKAHGHMRSNKTCRVSIPTEDC